MGASKTLKDKLGRKKPCVFAQYKKEPCLQGADGSVLRTDGPRTQNRSSHPLCFIPGSVFRRGSLCTAFALLDQAQDEDWISGTTSFHREE